MSKYVNLVNPSKSNFDGAVALTDSALSLVNSYATLNGISIDDVELCRVAVPIPYTIDNGLVNISFEELKLPSSICLCQGLLLDNKLIYGGAYTNFAKLFRLPYDAFSYNGKFITSANWIPTSVLVAGVEYSLHNYCVNVGQVVDDYAVLLDYYTGEQMMLDDVPLYLSQSGVVFGKVGDTYSSLVNVDGACTLNSYDAIVNKTAVLNRYHPDNELSEVFLYCRSKLL